jgi:hypothetical protein
LYLPYFIYSMNSTELSIERLKTFRERCIQANEKYSKLFAKFRTHNFLDWGVLTQVQEEGYLKAVPPYCERFDEFLGYWLSGGTPINVSATLEEFFPEPDEVDCSYLEDVLIELAQVWGGPREVYITHKGSQLGIGPGVCWCYADNIARAQQWVQDVKERLLMEKALHLSQSKPQAQAAYSAKSSASLSSFFHGGFTVKNFDQLLITLGILGESRNMTEDSKPRTWVSVLQALLDAKVLIHSSHIALHEALVQEYGNQDSLPKPRTLQKGYNSDNAQARDFYARAIALLKLR